jgi:hypothetical protein
VTAVVAVAVSLGVQGVSASAFTFDRLHQNFTGSADPLNA